MAGTVIEQLHSDNWFEICTNLKNKHHIIRNGSDEIDDGFTATDYNLHTIVNDRNGMDTNSKNKHHNIRNGSGGIRLGSDGSDEIDEIDDGFTNDHIQERIQDVYPHDHEERNSKNYRSPDQYGSIRFTDHRSPDSLHYDQDSYSSSGNLIINYIPPNLTEEELLKLFRKLGPVDNVKIVRKKPEGHSLGYAFVKYVSPFDTKKAIRTFNGYRLQNKVLKVSVARPSCPDIKDANLYISGIPKHFTQAHLQSTFSTHGKIINCKIITDGSGQSRGIGFVRYNTKSEALAAVQQLNKHFCPGSSVPLQVKLAEKPSHRNVRSGMFDEMNKLLSSYKLDPRTIPPSLSNILKQYFQFPSVNEEGSSSEAVADRLESSPPLSDSVCLYVYNLPPETDKAFLLSLFEKFGEIISVRPIIHYPTMQCKGFGFVNMRNQSSALRAIHDLHGKILNGKPLQVSFKKYTV